MYRKTKLCLPTLRSIQTIGRLVACLFAETINRMTFKANCVKFFFPGIFNCKNWNSSRAKKMNLQYFSILLKAAIKLLPLPNYLCAATYSYHCMEYSFEKWELYVYWSHLVSFIIYVRRFAYVSVCQSHYTFHCCQLLDSWGNSTQQTYRN